MPIITVNKQSFETEADKRLVLAIEDAGINILHRCGGYAKCTTCRVVFKAGEPERMTEKEKQCLQSEDGLYGKIRLSCQILCDHDMDVVPQYTLENSDVDSAGKRPEDHVTPNPVWTIRD